jgi:hypothetical protein
VANLIESPSRVVRAAVGDPVAADKLPDPPLQDAQLVVEAARREARLSPNPRHGLRRKLGPEPPSRGLGDEPRVHPQED